MEVGKLTIKELRQRCQATAPNPAMETYAGRFCRIFSIYATKLFLYTSITPNKITILGSLVFFAGTFTYFGSYWVTLFGPLLYFLSIVIDGADGEVARFRKTNSKFGTPYVEPVSHDIQYGFFFFIISIALFYKGFPEYIIIFGALASITKLLYRSLQIRFWNAVYAGSRQEDKETQIKIHKNRNFVVKFLHLVNRNFFNYPAILPALLIATVFARMDIFIYFYALGFTLLFTALLFKQIYHINRTETL